MQKITCVECGKRYDYQEDAFCCHCGAFNQPPKSTQIAADGSVVRVDGLSEVGRAGSFAHQEFHEEEKSRRKSGLAKGVQRIPLPEESKQTAAPRRSATVRIPRESEQQLPKNIATVIKWVVIGIVFLNLIFPLMLRNF